MLTVAMRHLEARAIDDALDLSEILMATRLISTSKRATDEERLSTLPQLEKAARITARLSQVVIEELDSGVAQGGVRERRAAGEGQWTATREGAFHRGVHRCAAGQTLRRGAGVSAGRERAMASASAGVTESTPGRMPAAVTQCTSGVPGSAHWSTIAVTGSPRRRSSAAGTLVKGREPFGRRAAHRTPYRLVP